MLKRFILTGLVLGFSLSLFSQVNPDTLPEKYVPKVIIEAKWGNGPGEFGFKPDSEIPPDGIGPCGLTISDNKIYILDAVNRRINVYSTNGSFARTIKLKGKGMRLLFFNPGFTALRRDKEGNFYLLGYWEKAGQEILKFDSTGNFMTVVFRSPSDKEGYRIEFGPYLEVKGDSLILRASEGLTKKGPTLFYINRNTKDVIIENAKKKAREEKEFYYYPKYPKCLKEKESLPNEIKNFVLYSRDFSQVLGAKSYDTNGNFYELLWSPCKYHNMGVKVLKWERIR